MHRWMMSAIATAVLVVGTAAHAQAAPQASDSWQRPASPSSTGVAYGGSPAATPHESHSAFRFKDDDKNRESRFQLSSPKRRYGRPDNICEANPTSSTCRQAPPPRPGQAF